MCETFREQCIWEESLRLGIRGCESIGFSFKAQLRLHANLLDLARYRACFVPRSPPYKTQLDVSRNCDVSGI
jgi:hypothetical protein